MASHADTLAMSSLSDPEKEKVQEHKKKKKEKKEKEKKKKKGDDRETESEADGKKKKEKEKKHKSHKKADDADERFSTSTYSDAAADDPWVFKGVKVAGPRHHRGFFRMVHEHLVGGGDVQSFSQDAVVAAYRENFERPRWSDADVLERWNRYVRVATSPEDDDSSTHGGSRTPPQTRADDGDAGCATAIHVSQLSDDRFQDDDMSAPVDSVDSPAAPQLALAELFMRKQQTPGDAAQILTGSDLSSIRTVYQDDDARKLCALQRSLTSGGAALRARVRDPDCTIRYSVDLLAWDTLQVTCRCVGEVTYCCSTRVALHDTVVSADWEACVPAEVIPPAAWDTLRRSGWDVLALGPSPGGCAYPDAQSSSRYVREVLRLTLRQSPSILLLFSRTHVGCVAEVDIAPPPAGVRCHFVCPTAQLASVLDHSSDRRSASPAPTRAVSQKLASS
eukprot:TRINITY_DN3546_c0_g1_i2.p1 TRINITY_DN3546_c0_g1~~TRINITY_DN3546_c0_g1_i2.p1  ORF type:complete len:449 (+),score=145.63 TRINITY_DN3546_c0_g1_i2:121-1467(+)